MINTVEKNYSDINENDFNYKVTYSNEEIIFVPHNEANRHYQEILEWVAEGNTITDNGGGE
jgi:hypothetical protein|tara:strand:- start:158 stop:340 length:183 start_codon:yes stop_codon:yes gene_type:complete